MSQINLISFPRSGQHLTERVLRFYCGRKKIKFSYCEFYNHCRTFPCKSKRKFQKNHDFNLDLPILPEQKYIVLYRNNIEEQIEAYFRFDLKERWGLVHVGKIEYQDPNKRDQLIKYIHGKTDYYIKFLRKWVFNNNKNIYKIEYNKLLKNNYLYLKVFNHIFPEIDHKNDKKILDMFLKKEKISKKTEINLDFN